MGLVYFEVMVFYSNKIEERGFCYSKSIPQTYFCDHNDYNEYHH